MGRWTRPFLYALAALLWAGGVAYGAGWLWRYEGAEGVAAKAPVSWPTDAKIVANKNTPTLVMMIHPHCPCSRATIGELSKLMTTCQGKLSAMVLMVKPAGAEENFEKTDLWESARMIPGVAVITDQDGVESKRFGAATSGQAILYSAGGELLFSGGITESRGHSGDNAGRAAITEIVLKAASLDSVARTPVYGCSLLSCRKVEHKP